MGERIIATDTVEVDGSFVSRLLLGALSEHEQRLLAQRLIRVDAPFRDAMASFLRPFEMFDLDLVEEYAQVLAPGQEVERRRAAILERSHARSGDLGRMIRDFTFSDVFELGRVTRGLFSWSMAEHLLKHTQRVDVVEHRMKTNLYLATMVIDVVEILLVARHRPLKGGQHGPRFPSVVEDVRHRIYVAAGQPPPRRTGL
jgi:hypothetical protein